MHLVVPPGGSFRETRRVELGATLLTIGRAASCEIRMDVPGVDDEHARISELAVIAVGSDCAVGDVPLDAGQRRLVSPGDELQIGSVVLALDGDDPALRQGQRRAGPRILVVEGKNVGAELVLAKENHEYVIGRSPKADLLLDDREVSREHLKVVRRGYSVFIYDQASTRGSWLGRSAVYQGSRIEWERPRMLKVGATVLSLDLPEEARRAHPAIQVSAPMMTPPPRTQGPPPALAPVGPAPTPPNVVAYHFEARPATPQPPRAVPATGGGGAHLPNIAPSPPPPRPSSPAGRTAWKKSGPTLGKVSGLLLLTLGGIAILGALFVVFSLME